MKQVHGNKLYMHSNHLLHGSLAAEHGTLSAKYKIDGDSVTNIYKQHCQHN